MLKVFIDLAQHNKVSAMVQVFINANTGEKIDPKELKNHILHDIFSDSNGRKVMVFKKSN